MHPLPELIKDLGFILMTAAVVTLLFRKLNQPVVLGYLIAGFLVGPHFPLIHTVHDVKSIHVWAEIGVIFLLFGLGLEFSFKKLAQVGRSAAITTIFEVLFMLGLGYLVGQFFGWNRMDSLFLGGILSISSTTIIVRAFDELGLKTRKFVSLVLGVLIVEDLVAILLLVLLSTVAATQTLSGSALFETTLKLSFFIILWFVVGIYLVPAFLQKTRILMTRETTLIVSIGLCLMMVLVASDVGFSPALGAFIMGSILAETREGETIEHLILPIKDLFAAIFFVSVGMLFDPAIVASHLGVIITITVVTILGKFLSSTLGALLSGESLKHSVQAGLSLAQIGEFSFIIATLGSTLNVTSDFLYPIAVAVSAITTFTTPYQIRYATSFYNWLDKRIPYSTRTRLESYQKALRNRSSDNMAMVLWNLYGIKILLNSVIIVAVALAFSRILMPFLTSFIENNSLLNLVACIVTLLACAPFFWPIALSAPNREALLQVKDLLHFKALQFGVVLFRLFLSVVLLGFVIGQFFSIATASGLVILALILVLMLLNRHTESFYLFFEAKFLSNLQEKETHELAEKKSLPELAPWDATLADFVLSPNSELALKPLQESRLKERFGVTIALIERGKGHILAPGGTELLLPFDRLFVIGDEEQLENARHAIESADHSINGQLSDAFGLDSLVLGDKSEFVNKSIRECGLREKINGLIVGIERDGRRILSPDSSIRLAARDIIWVVGDKLLLKKVRASE